ncbi:oligosaccharide flippase family protein [Empedobacter falsenii]
MTKESGNNTIQTFWVLIGSLSAFAFTIVSSMLLSRYFNKSDYGTYKQVMYVYNTLLIVFTLGLPRAYSYFLPRVSEGEAKDLISKLNYVLLGMGLIMTSCFFFGSNVIADILKNKELGLSLKYFALVPLFMLPTMGVDGILATYKQTKFLAIYKTLTQIFMLCAVTLPVILFSGTVNTAILGFTVASFLSFLLALFFKYKPIKEFKREKSSISYKDIFNYTLPIMGATLWGIVISSSDQFFISRYFGNNVFADFANGSLELPFVGMIIASTTTVLSPVFSKYVFDKGIESKNEVLLLWKSTLSKTVKIIYPLVVFCFCFSTSIMTILYGEKYFNSGIYFQIKLIVNFFTVITYGPLLLSIGGQKFYFNVHMYGAFLLVGLEWLIVVYTDSPYLITVTSVFCQITRIICMLFFISTYFKIKLFDLFPIKLVLNIIVPSLIVLYALKYLSFNILFFNNIESILFSFVIYILFFSFWVYYKKIDYLSILKPIYNNFIKQ